MRAHGQPPHPQQHYGVPGYPPMQAYPLGGLAPPPQWAPMQQPPFMPNMAQGYPAEPAPPPTPPPADTAAADAIEKLAPFVVRNGPAFEEKMRRERGADPKFAFLFGGPDHAYYRWVLHCYRMGFTPEQRQQMAFSRSGIPSHGISAFPGQPNGHAAPPQQSAAGGGALAPGMYVQTPQQAGVRPAMPPNGAIPPPPQQQHQPAGPPEPQHSLSAEDEHALHQLVGALIGSADSLAAARNFVLARLSYQGAALAVKLREHVHAAQLAASTRAVPHADAFARALNIVYVVNDLLFGLAHEPPNGRATPFRRELLRQMPTMLQSLALLAPTAAEKERAAALVRGWDERALFPSGALQPVHAAMVDLAQQAPVPTPPPLLPPRPPIQQPLAQQPPRPPGAPMSHMPGMPPLFPQGVLAHHGLPMPPNVAANMASQAQQQAAAAAAAVTGASRWSSAPPPGPANANNAAAAFAVARPPMPGSGGGAAAAATTTQQMFPVAAGLASAAHQHGHDLENMPVGAMVSFIKLALKVGMPRYSPIDIKVLPPAPPPHVEPGRLDVRVEEFYRHASRHADEEKADKAEPKLEERDAGRRGSRSRSRERERRRGDSRDRDRRKGSSREREQRPQAAAQAPESAQERAIADDNIGHSLLKRLGWNEGAGLGAAGEGIAEPIKNAGQVDKAGLGTQGESADEFEKYRKTKSTAYHRF